MKAARIRGPWNKEQIERFLHETVIPVQLACNGPTGFPTVASHWFQYIDGEIYCAIQSDSHIAALLERDPRCAFEVAVQEPPYRGVRGQALASLDRGRGPGCLQDLIDRYLDASNTRLAQWLSSRSDNEMALVLTPVSISSWDYEARMSRPQ